MVHLPDAALLRHLLDDTWEPDAAAHLDSCPSCRDRVTELRRASLDDTHHSGEPGVASAEARALEAGAQLGRYTLLERIGAGGMGEVFAAYDPQLDRRVALKLLRADRADAGTEGRARLLREAQAMARLSHPSVVTVHDVGTWKDEVFVAMEFVEGTTLQEWLSESPRPLPEVVRVLREAGEGLWAAHAAGLVHRDFKPSNVLLRQDGRACVADFGLARSVELGAEAKAAAPLPLDAPAGPLVTPLTDAGQILGTPGYCPPEQLWGGGLDPRADQFSYCVTFYEALYGKRPFAGTTLRELVSAMSAPLPEAPPDPDLAPPALYRALRRGLEADPERRYPSLRELLRDIDQATSRRRGRWALWAAAAGVLLLGAGAVAARLDSSAPCEGVGDAVEAVWNPEEDQRLRAAFAATGKDFAIHAAGGAVRALEAWAGQWRQTRIDACQATLVREETPQSTLALRNACLQLRLEELRSLVQVLTTADAEIARHAPGAVSRLTAPGTCLSPDALMSVQKLPEDPAARGRIEALRTKLAEARASLEAGKHLRALAALPALAKEATASGFAPVEAEAWLLLAAAQERDRAFDAAQASLHRSARAAIAYRDTVAAARAWMRLGSVLALGKNDFAQAAEWQAYARTALERSAVDGRTRAELLHRGAVLLMEIGRYPESLREAEEALRVYETEVGGEDLLLVQILDNLAYALSWLNRHEEAVAHFERAIPLAKKVLGPSHPEVGVLLEREAMVVWELYELDRADALIRQAMAIHEAALPADHVQIGLTLNHLALVQQEQGHLEAALESSLRSMEIARRTLGPDHVRIGAFSHTAGEIAYGLRRYEEALRFHKESDRIYRKALGADAAYLIYPLTGMGLTHLALGHARAALASLEEAERLIARGDPLPAERGKARLGLAQALRRTGGDAARIRAVVEAARKDLLAAGPKGAQDLALLDRFAQSLDGP